MWCGALAVTSAFFGGHWDIAWHRSIGRDVLVGAAHRDLCVGILAGISAGDMIFSTTFGKNAGHKDLSVRIWGLRGPLGAFMNRAGEQMRPALEWMFLYVGGTVLCESLLIKLESISRSDQHNARFYFVVLTVRPPPRFRCG
ncbi:MAG: hypothetical protein K2Y23_22965 [Cyanobacteria bacterium]|nr:hypothetical protein [Cyanobacteriota bacterium]